MNARVLIICFAIGLTNIAFSSTSFGQGEAEFAKANQEYAAGHFKEAIDAYKQSTRSGGSSATLFYDLGNAYFHTGDFGSSILSYERALALDRHHPEAQANLQIARDEARALEMAPDKARRFAQFGDRNQFAITAGIAFWIGIFCIAGWGFSGRRSTGIFALSFLCLLIAAGAVAAIIVGENGNTGRGFAVVTGNNVSARLATADNAQTVLALPAGSEIKILSKRGDWIFATLPNDLRGWIPAKDAEPVRL
jgi:tetratricopeptide (TPR) repeat protein